MHRIGSRAHVFLGIWVVIQLLSACTPIRPVVKIGLVAPFEGLYRRTGYEALSATRAAITERDPATNIDILPLALDDSADPARARRTVQKMLQDPDVAAVVGPLTPALADQVADLMGGDGSPPWIRPFAVDPDGGFEFGLDETAWATGLISAVAQAAQTQGASRLWLAGWTPGWPDLSDAAWSTVADFPVQVADDDGALPKGLRTDDAVLWLGNPDTGADYLSALRESEPGVQFWLGPQGGDAVFVERAPLTGAEYWAIWGDQEYNRPTETDAPSTPSADLIHRATQQAMSSATGVPWQPASGWQVRLFQIDPDGSSRPWSPPE